MSRLERARQSVDSSKKYIREIADGIKSNDTFKDFYDKQAEKELPTPLKKAKNVAKTAGFVASRELVAPLVGPYMAITGETFDGRELSGKERASLGLEGITLIPGVSSTVKGGVQAAQIVEEISRVKKNSKTT